MKVLLTGANGYIGQRLLPQLIEEGYHVVCCVRDRDRFHPKSYLKDHITVIEADLSVAESLQSIPNDIDVAYYLVHSMSQSSDYAALELQCAVNFREAMESTRVRQVIYLSGIVNNAQLSDHLSSRKNVESELGMGAYALTTLRAGIIIGSGSASFEIIRDLVEKLPLMVAPKWIDTRCQPIAIGDVLKFLMASLDNKDLYHMNYDIGGKDILTYKEMLLGFAKVRGLKRNIMSIPVMTPRLSSYWLYFVTATSYKLAVALVDSMKVEVVCRNDEINGILDLEPMGYEEAIRRAFIKIENYGTYSSWKDAFVSSDLQPKLSELIIVPKYGCFVDKQSVAVQEEGKTLDKIWRIGGKTGWYAYNGLWKLRGFLDQIAGGVGLRRGRTSDTDLSSGDAIDFWRVIFANRDEKRLLLYAEMKLPGEAWLEFKIEDGLLHQTATFRPLGLWGRIYWHLLFPFHFLIFRTMAKNISNGHGIKREG
jgi:uncharacterized protein YbjT (DUF2867 family)